MEKITEMKQAKQNSNTGQPKRKRGRPIKIDKAPPTFLKAFRFNQEMIDFFNTMKNKNQSAFVASQIKKTKEFQDFIANQEDKSTAPKLPYFDYNCTAENHQVLDTSYPKP